MVFKSLNYLKIHKGIEPNIVLTGNLFNGQDEFSNEILFTINKYNINSQVFLLGLIPKKDQFILLRKSIAVIQPSLFEGWSTILEESRSLGKSIIVSNLNVHKEQNYSKSIYFEKDSYQDLALKVYNFFQTASPGPDLNAEKAFYKENKILMNEFAHKFIRLSKLNL